MFWNTPARTAKPTRDGYQADVNQGSHQVYHGVNHRPKPMLGMRSLMPYFKMVIDSMNFTMLTVLQTGPLIIQPRMAMPPSASGSSKSWSRPPPESHAENWSAVAVRLQIGIARLRSAHPVARASEAPGIDVAAGCCCSARLSLGGVGQAHNSGSLNIHTGASALPFCRKPAIRYSRPSFLARASHPGGKSPGVAAYFASIARSE